MSSTLPAEVLYGINTIYCVRCEDRLMQCRIKGKVLGRQKREGRSYNPIAPGDRVAVIPDPLSTREGLIVEVLERKSSLTRWNKKGRATQVLAANADLAVCVSSPGSPPFRPRFIDRLAVAAEAGGLEPVVVLNKADLPCPSEIRERLEHYKRMGYRVLTCSARSGEGIVALREALQGKTAVLVGQSGVGKSSILNSMSPALQLKVGELSQKHDRGSHTTNYSSLLLIEGDLRIIDTPGVRELELAEILPEEVGFHFRDFTPHSSGCEFQPCLHAGEPGCAVVRAVERGEIHADRYESYLRIVRELQDSERQGRG
ncbi:MAG TPA: ribosome small subunit-dependent GTPase A [Spirochaetia bacterium]|nr:ribosome small subunit-dependent GTPase A [Spirochaetia bacterium]